MLLAKEHDEVTVIKGFCGVPGPAQVRLVNGPVMLECGPWWTIPGGRCLM